MKEEKLRSNEKEEPIQNKKSTKNRSNLISNHQSLISDHKGITLIALIITIIVMLILVGVTVTVALNGGLFNQAKEATRNTKEEKRKEKELSKARIKVGDIWYDSYEDYVSNIPSENQSDEPAKWEEDENGNIIYEGEFSGLKVGDYVDYTYDTVEAYPLPITISGYSSDQTINQVLNLKWRILGIDKNGCLTLISATPLSGTTVGLQNAKGYNNGVYVLNDICKTLYSNTTLGVTARNLTIEDVEAGFSETGIAERNKYTYAGVQYGQPQTYTNSLNYPILYAKENGSGIGVTDSEKETGRKTNGIGGSNPFYTEETKDQLTNKLEGKENDIASEALTCTQTFYYFNSAPKNYCKNENFYNMIFDTNTYYWLASRYVICAGGYASFGLRTMGLTNLGGNFMLETTGRDGVLNRALRPVVPLSSDVKVECVSGASNPDTPHKLSK